MEVMLYTNSTTAIYSMLIRVFSGLRRQESSEKSVGISRNTGAFGPRSRLYPLEAAATRLLMAIFTAALLSQRGSDRTARPQWQSGQQCVKEIPHRNIHG